MKLRIILIFLVFMGWNYSAHSENVEYRIIYLIHADGNYLYHDNDGNAVNAAERILNQAQKVGEEINRGEVFIFYQKPAENFLFFTKDDGEFYYYKNNKLVSEDTYSRINSSDFQAEANLINYNSEDKSVKKKNIFLYYGHEIPGSKSSGYHSSYPGKEFDINIFSKGLEKILQSFQNDNAVFDLIVLSTCRNGNEKTISALSSLTDYLIASPGDIHLSHLNSKPLIDLSNEEQISTESLSEEFAESAFKELADISGTEITINVYNLNISDASNKIMRKLYRQGEFGVKKNQLNKDL